MGERAGILSEVLFALYFFVDVRKDLRRWDIPSIDFIISTIGMIIVGCQRPGMFSETGGHSGTWRRTGSPLPMFGGDARPDHAISSLI